MANPKIPNQKKLVTEANAWKNVLDSVVTRFNDIENVSEKQRESAA